MHRSNLAPAALVAATLLLAACGDDNHGGSQATATATATGTTIPQPTPTPGDSVPDTVPDFSAASFTHPTSIDNALFPLVPDTTRTFLGDTEDGSEINVVDVLNDTRVVAGVTCRTVHDRVFRDGLLIEDTHDFYAQDDTGTVWYLGEEVDDYEYDDEGKVTAITHGGAWEAGRDVAALGVLAKPGHIMKAAPAVGDRYSQEYYPSVAEDTAEVLARDAPVTLADGSTYACLETREFTPLEPDVDAHKFYAPGVGAVLETGAGERNELRGTFLTGPASIPQFDPADFSDPTRIDNPLLPWVPGITFRYESETEDGTETTVVEVLSETRPVAGVTARVVRDRVSLDDLLIEDTHDWYAQDDDGNVWYLGEQVDEYEYDDDDQLIDITHEGSWEAGQDVAGVGSTAVPGIVMRAQPRVGESYRQEFYPQEAEDMAYIVRSDAPLEVDGETLCEHCLQTLEWNPLEPGVLEYKFYASGSGLVAEQDLGSGELTRLVDIEAP